MANKGQRFNKYPEELKIEYSVIYNQKKVARIMKMNINPFANLR